MTLDPIDPPVSTSSDVAAVDLGSNSFHMMVARPRGHEVTVVDRIRESVRLGAGLDNSKRLTPEAAERALSCLQRFGQRLRDLPAEHVRVVGTNTLRRMRNGQTFLDQAEEALGHPVEVISGNEEARLIYGGVVHGLGMERHRRLVMDIGGGSTEVIIGDGATPRLLESVRMGCVAWTEQYFGKGKISAKAFAKARLAARVELEFMEMAYRDAGWDVCLGASGTIRSIAKVIAAHDSDEHASVITPGGLEQAVDLVLDAGRSDKLDLAGLRDDRRPIFAGGLAVLCGLFDALDMDRMQVSDRALREGVVYDLLGRLADRDIRDATVRAYMDRFDLDPDHAGRVRETATALHLQVANAWDIGDPMSLRLLGWAADLHEVGMSISHASYHKHGEYLLKHADLDGFSRSSQQLLAALVRLHRGKLRLGVVEGLPRLVRTRVLNLALVLRLAVIMHRGRGTAPPPVPALSGSARKIALTLPDGWLEEYPLTRADLERECGLLDAVGIELTLD